jgi:AcrR family transcriptional regulator
LAILKLTGQYQNNVAPQLTRTEFFVRTKTALQADKMLDAAAELFSSQRFHEVRMEDIAAAAGVGKGTIYRYFSDKEELYLALLDRASKQIREGLEQAVQGVEGARAKFKAIVAAIISYFDSQPHLLDLIQRAEVARGPDFPWRKTREELWRRVTTILEEGKVRGEFAVQDPDLTALLLLAGLRGVLRFGKKPRPRDLAQRIVDIFLQEGDISAHPIGKVFAKTHAVFPESSRLY